LREVESLRRDVPRKKSDRGTNASDVLAINKRTLTLPIHVDPARAAQIRSLVLFASTDEGSTWQLAAEASPAEKAFTYNAPADGLYWFSVSVVTKDGNREPRSPNASPDSKVLVDTVKPEVTLRAWRHGEEFEVSWSVKDDNPGGGALRLSYLLREQPTALSDV